MYVAVVEEMFGVFDMTHPDTSHHPPRPSLTILTSTCASPAMLFEPLQITATLVSSGIKAVVMNQTLGHPLTGCFGHPSAADNLEIAANVAPAMASVLGW